MSTWIKCDQCGRQTIDQRHRYADSMGPDYSWVVLYVEANEDADHGHLCSWSCLASFATEKAMSREMDSHPWGADVRADDPSLPGRSEG